MAPSAEAVAEKTTATDGPLVSAARTVEHGVEKAVEKAKGGIEKAKGGIEKAKFGASQAKEGLAEMKKKSIGELADNVTDYAKEHPGQTILVSLGVGTLIGMLIARR